MKSLIRWGIFLIGLAGFSRAAQTEASIVAKVVVKADGSLFVDGKKVAVRDLDSLLLPIKERKGVVWYYRANPQGEPHPVAMEVLKVVVAKQIPIKLFSKEDFSEYVGADGKSHKQKRG